MLGASGEPRRGSDEVTRDTLLRGRVTLIQPTAGFRSSLDPVLLAGFLRPPYGRFLDLGCGTGAVAFLLLARDLAARGLGIDIQPRLAALAARATAENGFSDRFEVLVRDARDGDRLPRGCFDLVASNPPYRALGTGKLPPDDERSIAHHEVALTLGAWVSAAATALRPGGRLGAVHRADRLQDIRTALAANGFSLVRMRFVASHPGAAAQRVLFEAVRGEAGALIVEPALVVHDGTGYALEVRQMLGEP